MNEVGLDERCKTVADMARRKAAESRELGDGEASSLNQGEKDILEIRSESTLALVGRKALPIERTYREELPISVFNQESAELGGELQRMSGSIGKQATGPDPYLGHFYSSEEVAGFSRTARIVTGKRTSGACNPADRWKCTKWQDHPFESWSI